MWQPPETDCYIINLVMKFEMCPVKKIKKLEFYKQAKNWGRIKSGVPDVL